MNFTATLVENYKLTDAPKSATLDHVCNMEQRWRF